MKAPRLVVSLLLAALAVPSTAAAQRDGFLAAWVEFYQTVPGAYGDEGPRLAAQLEKMTTALAAWDREIRDAESQLQARLKGADVQTALQVHAVLASLYLDRSRFDDALREFEAAIGIDSTRAAFHRYKGLIYQATARPAEAADAFRSAWRLDPMDPQNAYRLIVYRSKSTTRQEVEQALAAFAVIEAELIRLARPRSTSPFRTTQAIDTTRAARWDSCRRRTPADSPCCSEDSTTKVSWRFAPRWPPTLSSPTPRPARSRWRKGARRCSRVKSTPRSTASKLPSRAPPIRRRRTGSWERRTESAAT